MSFSWIPRLDIVRHCKIITVRSYLLLVFRWQMMKRKWSKNNVKRCHHLLQVGEHVWAIERHWNMWLNGRLNGLLCWSQSCLTHVDPYATSIHNANCTQRVQVQEHLTEKRRPRHLSLETMQSYYADKWFPLLSWVLRKMSQNTLLGYVDVEWVSQSLSNWEQNWSKSVECWASHMVNTDVSWLDTEDDQLFFFLQTVFKATTICWSLSGKQYSHLYLFACYSRAIYKNFQSVSCEKTVSGYVKALEMYTKDARCFLTWG